MAATVVKYLPNVIDSVKQMYSRDVTKTDTPLIECHLAASYGALKDHLKEMDEGLKVMIGVTIKQMNKDKVTEWKDVISSMMQNPCLEPMEEKEVHRYDTFKRESTDWFKFDGSADAQKTSEVEQWIKALISDEDVLKDLKFDKKMYAQIVASTGAAVDSFATFFASTTYKERSVIEIGVLRYPDIDHPYFKVYRVYLKAWARCERVLAVEHNSNGIIGDFNCRKFKPRDSVIKELKEITKEKAVKMVDDLFDD